MNEIIGDHTRTEPIVESVDELMAELFDRELPTDYKHLIDDVRGKFQGLGDDALYSSKLLREIGAGNVFSVEDFPESIPENQLTELGKLLREKINHRDVFDLGAGLGQFVEHLAKMFSARRYVGVDLADWTEEMGADFYKPKLGDHTKMYRITDDMLSFIGRLKDESGGVFYFSGIEAIGFLQPPAVVIKYCETLFKELHRVMKRGDLLVFGPTGNPYNSPNFLVDAQKLGFKKIDLAQGKTEHKVYEKQ